MGRACLLFIWFWATVVFVIGAIYIGLVHAAASPVTVLPTPRATCMDFYRDYSVKDLFFAGCRPANWSIRWMAGEGDCNSRARQAHRQGKRGAAVERYVAKYSPECDFYPQEGWFDYDPYNWDEDTFTQPVN